MVQRKKGLRYEVRDRSDCLTVIPVIPIYEYYYLTLDFHLKVTTFPLIVLPEVTVDEVDGLILWVDGLDQLFHRERLIEVDPSRSSGATEPDPQFQKFPEREISGACCFFEREVVADADGHHLLFNFAFSTGDTQVL